MLRVLSQLVSDNVLAHPSVHIFSWVLKNKFQVANFLFSGVWQNGRGKHIISTATENL